MSALDEPHRVYYQGGGGQSTRVFHNYIKAYEFSLTVSNSRIQKASEPAEKRGEAKPRNNHYAMNLCHCGRRKLLNLSVCNRCSNNV